MGGECSVCVGEKRFIESLVGKLRERDHLEDPGVDRRMVLKWIFKGIWGLNWIDLDQ
jgi:hypothetical protein